MKKVKNKIKDEEFAKMQKVYKPRGKYIAKDFHIYMSYGTRVFLMFLSIIVLAFVAYICFDDSFSEPNNISLGYEKKATVDYKVKLFDNNIYEGTFKPVDSYISDAIENISTDLNYYFKIDNKSDIEYTYRVDAIMELRSNSNGDLIAYNENQLIPTTEPVTLKSTDNLSLKQNVLLDYDSYNNSAKLFAKQHSNINGNLFLELHVNIKVKNGNFENIQNMNEVVKVRIPLLSTQVNASMVENVDGKGSYKEHKNPELVNELTLVMGIALLIIDTIFFLLAVSFVFRTTPKKTKYMKLRDGLLRDYDKVIVNGKNIPKLDGLNLIECYSFSELMDAQRLLEKPIIYNEIVKNQKSSFIIISDKDAYRFILKEADIDF